MTIPNNYVMAKRLNALPNLANSVNLAAIGNCCLWTIVELPPLKRRIEWPTAALAAVIYGSWLTATYFYRDLPWWGLTAIGAWIIAWQLNLQHETIHGHPTRKRAVNEAIGAGRCRCGFPIRSTARPISPTTGTRI